MRGLGAAVVVTAAVVCVAPAPARAGVDPPWCARGFGNDYYENCGYYTWQQCMASVSGVGGGCFPNPRYWSRSGEPRHIKKRNGPRPRRY
jgi:hypothetical protein